MNNIYNTTTKREEITLKERGNLYITQEMQDKIDYLHKWVGSKEWCGVQFYTIDEGDISDPKSLKITCKDMYLQDIGTEAFTSADFTTESIIDMYDSVPDAENMIKGKVHSHHNMKCWHSGTDMDDLHDNAPLHNAYLSLIVNFDGKYDAKIAFVAKRKIDLSFKNSTNESIEETKESELLVIIDLNIHRPQVEPTVSLSFQERYEKVKKEKEEKRTVGFTHWQSNWDANWNTGVDKSYTRTYGDWDESPWNKNYIDINLTDHRAVKSSSQQANLFNSRNFKPLAEVQEDLREKVFLILKMSAEELDYIDQKVLAEYQTVISLLEFIERYFEELGDEKYDEFLTKVKNNALIVMGDIKPALVEKHCSNVFEGIQELESNSVSIDIENIFSCWSSILEEENTKGKFNVNAKISKNNGRRNKRKGK